MLQAGTASAADEMAGRFHDIEGRIGAIPGVGGDLASPFRGAASAAESLAAAGRSQAEAVADVALLVGIAVLLIPVLLVSVLYVPVRIRFVRRASGARRLAEADPALLALRALANQPLQALTQISDDPVGAWRAGDPAVCEAIPRAPGDRIAIEDCPHARGDAAMPRQQRWVVTDTAET